MSKCENCKVLSTRIEILKDAKNTYFVKSKQLESELAEYKWIPVTERLPEEITRIIATSMPAKGFIQTFDVLRYEPTYHSVWITRKYDFWMPIPPLPPKGARTRTVNLTITRKEIDRVFGKGAKT